MLAGVVVGTRLGIQATVFYLMAYLAMNLAAFAVIVAEEHERPDGDYLSALAGLGRAQPVARLADDDRRCSASPASPARSASSASSS